MIENKWLSPMVEQYKKYFGNLANVSIEIGSRDGEDSKFFQEQLGTTDIYAIDANPLAYKQIVKNYPEFKTFSTAVSNYVGYTRFVQINSEDKDHAGSSSIENYSFFEEAEYVTMKVPVITMDAFIEQNDLQETAIDIVKVDIEGYSYECIEGWEKYIHNVKMIHLETETFNRHENHKDNNEVINLMISKGFFLVGVLYEWGSHIQDQVWINSRYLNSYGDGSGNISSSIA